MGSPSAVEEEDISVLPLGSALKRHPTRGFHTQPTHVSVALKYSVAKPDLSCS
ncbi:unnamed protein product, partial [Bubo scandiacus]